MKSRMRRQYYCDFCRKSSGHAGHMRRHEEACTGNPNRVCKMCVKLGVVQRPIADIVADVRKNEAGLNKIMSSGEHQSICVQILRTAAQGCPACMLATLRDTWLALEWDFQEEMREAWKRIFAKQYEEGVE